MSSRPVVALALLASAPAMAFMGPSSSGYYRWSYSGQSADLDAPTHSFQSLTDLTQGTNPGVILPLLDEGCLCPPKVDQTP